MELNWNGHTQTIHSYRFTSLLHVYTHQDSNGSRRSANAPMFHLFVKGVKHKCVNVAEIPIELVLSDSLTCLKLWLKSSPLRLLVSYAQLIKAFPDGHILQHLDFITAALFDRITAEVISRPYRFSEFVHAEVYNDLLKEKVQSSRMFRTFNSCSLPRHAIEHTLVINFIPLTYRYKDGGPVK